MQAKDSFGNMKGNYPEAFLLTYSIAGSQSASLALTPVEGEYRVYENVLTANFLGLGTFWVYYGVTGEIITKARGWIHAHFSYLAALPPVFGLYTDHKFRILRE